MKMSDVRWELLPADDAVHIDDVRLVEPIAYDEPKAIKPIEVKQIIIEPKKEIVKRPRNEGTKKRPVRKSTRATA